jgi:hypothetical protein
MGTILLNPAQRQTTQKTGNVEFVFGKIGSSVVQQAA